MRRFARLPTRATPRESVLPARLALAAGSMLAGSVVLVRDAAFSGVAIGGSSLFAIVAVGYGIRRYRPVSPVFWTLLLWALAVGALGGTLTAAVPQRPPLSYLVDAVYLAGYTLFVVAALTLQPKRQGGRDWAGILDALTLAIAAAMLFWYFAVSSVLVDHLTFHTLVTGVVWPVYDLVLLIVLSRMVSADVRRDFTFLAAAAALLFSVVSDFWYAATTAAGGYLWGNATDALWVMPMVTLAAAGLHPSMRTFSAGQSASPFQITWPRVFVVGVGTFAVPILLAVHALGRGTLGVDAPALLLFSTLLVVVSVARTAEMVRQSRLVAESYRRVNEELRSSLDERARLHRELTHRVLHDPLTGLPNRRFLTELLESAHDTPGWRQLALYFIDLDDFKDLNDSLGHAAGDRALCEVARRLVVVLRGEDMVARLGGDEFAVVMAGVERSVVEEVGQRMLEAISSPLEIAGTKATLRASLGLAWGHEGLEPDGLLRDADVAMYTSKSRGKNQLTRFEPHMHESLVDRARLPGMLAEALTSGEVQLAYQPVVDLRDGRVDGVEALVRWTTPDGEVVAPLTMVRLAEESGLIRPLGRYVLARVAAQIRAWRAQGLSLNVAVNVSPLQLCDPDLMAAVKSAAAELGPDQALVIEITESALVRGSDEEMTVLEEMRRLGCRVAVDDFGTGFSSLAYLTRLPIDVVKIDRSFVDHIDDHRAGFSVARAILSLSEALGFRVVAEGVERPEEADTLRDLGCTLAQGYHLARAGAPHDVQDYLRDHRRPGPVPDATLARGGRPGSAAAVRHVGATAGVGDAEA